MNTRNYHILLWSLLLASSTSYAAEVVVVPFSQVNPALPHLAHEGAQITLKAVVRNATIGDTYEVRWDTNGDGDYSNDAVKNYTVDSTGSIRDIGRTYLVGNVASNQLSDIGVQVRNTTTNQNSLGSFKLLTRDFTPSNDPRSWTNDQRNVMSAMSSQETMWNLYRNVVNLSGNGTGVAGNAAYAPATANFIQMFAENNRQPAYAPGAYSGSSYAGWQAKNDARWTNDPYADTVMRLVNNQLATGSLQSIPSGEELSTQGYNANGNAVSIFRFPETVDNRGLRFSSAEMPDGGAMSSQGAVVAALSNVIPALAGTNAQVGGTGVQGQLFEVITQQAVDYLGYGQIDGSSGKGGWSFNPTNGSASLSSNRPDATGWARLGLEAVLTKASPFGVMVPNRFRYRIADLAVTGQNSDGGYRYGTSSQSGIAHTAEMVAAMRSMGVHNFPAGDNTVAFPNESGRTRAQLRTSYDRAIAYLSSNWTASLHTDGVGWADSPWEDGDYLVGNTNTVYNAGRTGNTHTLFWLSEVMKAGAPDLEQVGSHDVEQEINTYFMRAQDRSINNSDPWANYDVFGRIKSDVNYSTNQTANFGNPYWSTVLAGLAMNPSISFDAQATSRIGVSATDLDFGMVRMGTSSGFQAISISEVVQGPLSVLYGEVSAADNGFEGAASSFLILAEDAPTEKQYRFTPQGFGTSQSMVSITSSDADQEIMLSGFGVGPMFAASVSTASPIDLGEVLAGEVGNTDLTLKNLAGQDLGDALTGLTLLSYEITGADASLFSLAGFTPGEVLSSLDEAFLSILFDNAAGSIGEKSATLTFVTDQNAAFGQSGDSFAFDLQATTIPEPSSLLLSTLAIGGLLTPRRRKK